MSAQTFLVEPAGVVLSAKVSRLVRGGGGGAITGVVSTEPRPGIVVVGTEPRQACVIALTTESRFAAKSAAAERRAALRVSMLSEVIVAIAS